MAQHVSNKIESYRYVLRTLCAGWVLCYKGKHVYGKTDIFIALILRRILIKKQFPYRLNYLSGMRPSFFVALKEWHVNITAVPLCITAITHKNRC